jgi:hypothetical protein
MQDFNAPHKLGEAVPDLIGENGLPVVKALTDELIDELGPKILSLFFIFSSFGFCSRGHFPVSANRMLKVHMYRFATMPGACQKGRVVWLVSGSRRHFPCGRPRPRPAG